MSGKPAARLSDPTTCPLPGHGENPIASGSPDVLFDSLPAARKGDVTACGSVITSNVSSTVFINSMPAAFLGSEGDHGGVIIGGSGTVIIGDNTTFEPALINARSVEPNIGVYDHYIELIDQDGLPLSNIPYQIYSSTGKTVQGLTFQDGSSQRVNGKSGDSFDYHIAILERL